MEVAPLTATLLEETTLEDLLGTVAATMRRDVVLLAADMPAERAVRRLEDKAVSGAPVVDRGRVVGVVTLRDLLVPTLLDHPGDPPNGRPRFGHRLAGLRVCDLMSDDPVTVRPDWLVDQEGRPLGVLTRDDVLRALVRGRARRGR
jgi:CBS domain-containing protein